MTIHILGGGTFAYIRNHLALAAPAFGRTARHLHGLHVESGRVQMSDGDSGFGMWNHSILHLTKMADSESSLVTNQDVDALLDRLIADPTTRVIYMNVALCDFTGTVGNIPSGKHAQRLQSSDYAPNPLLGGNNAGERIKLTQADKLLGKIRKTRKDIFLVAFKTTTGATSDEQYRAALNLLKANSVNLVVANDTVTRNNMIVAPEETRYHETTDRAEVLSALVEMVKARSSNTFTRSTVVEGDTVPWNSDMIPDNLRQVVDHCIARGAYKPFRGATAGHFAVRVDDNTCLTSIRKTNYNDLSNIGLVKVDYDGLDRVVAHGAKPSVGGQSQRIVFTEHPDMDCIVHAHIPLREKPRDLVPVADQWPHECGSHQCGANTSHNLRDFGDVKAVMLDSHGPNIVFSRNTPAAKVIDFIEANFVLEEKTGGLVSA